MARAICGMPEASSSLVARSILCKEAEMLFYIGKGRPLAAARSACLIQSKKCSFPYCDALDPAGRQKEAQLHGNCIVHVAFFKSAAIFAKDFIEYHSDGDIAKW